MASFREKFRPKRREFDLRWVPTDPDLINYPNAQFLMIGEAQGDLGKAATAEPGVKESGQEEPGEELGKFEEENEERIEALDGMPISLVCLIVYMMLMFSQAIIPFTVIWDWMQVTIQKFRLPGRSR